MRAFSSPWEVLTQAEKINCPSTTVKSLGLNPELGTAAFGYALGSEMVAALALLTVIGVPGANADPGAPMISEAPAWVPSVCQSPPSGPA